MRRKITPRREARPAGSLAARAASNRARLALVSLCAAGLVCSSLALLAPGSRAQSPAASAKVYKFVNGRWFDGRGFRRRTFYSAGGRLASRRPGRVDETVDLGGGYVVPPFGEAHNHNVDGKYNIAQVARQYLRDGVFYVKNPNNLRRLAAELAGSINTPESIDAVFSNGGLTAAGGHPQPLYDNLAKGAYRQIVGDGSLENEGYFLINDAAELEKKWPLVVAGRPDFIKTYLLYSEEYAKRRDDPKPSSKGLDPELLPHIVSRAHAAGLRVSAHVETAADFRHAVAAGVDEISHLPGYYIRAVGDAARFHIAEADARRAAHQGTVVVTTTGVSRNFYAKDREPARLNVVRETQARNLRLLHRSGVRLAVGSDQWNHTSLVEAMNLHGLRVFDNLTLLRMWCETTAQTIYPRRRIGRLRPGYEASFLVLGADPLADFEAVKRITHRFKQGRPLTLPPPE